MRTLKLVLAYDGTRYVGWQRQPNGVSVQALLEDALSPLDQGRAVRCVAAGRTDAGVHATGQVVSCRTRSMLTPASLGRALNARLPPDVRVLDVTEAPDGFHARFWSRAKTYVYRVQQGPVADPLARDFVWHVRHDLDVSAMKQAADALRGRHDFRAFQAAGGRVTDTVRWLTTLAIDLGPWPGLLSDSAVATAPDLRAGSLLTFRFTGDGFLRHMVRNIVGTLMEVGAGRRAAASVAGILASRDRRTAGETAPARGLVLASVEYGPGPTRDRGASGDE